MNVYKKINQNILSIVLEQRDMESSTQKMTQDFEEALELREDRNVLIKLIDISDIPSQVGVALFRLIELLYQKKIQLSLLLDAELLDLFMELNLGDRIHSIQVNP